MSVSSPSARKRTLRLHGTRAGHITKSFARRREGVRISARMTAREEYGCGRNVVLRRIMNFDIVLYRSTTVQLVTLDSAIGRR